MAGVSTGQDRWPRFAGAGRYELRCVLGSGRTGIVHEAYDRDLGRTVALKTLRTLEPEALYRLKREFRTPRRACAHPNLVPFFDLYVEDDERFFTMELIAGESFVEHFRAALLRGDAATTRTPRCAPRSCSSRRASRRCTGTASCTATSSRRTC